MTASEMREWAKGKRRYDGYHAHGGYAAANPHHFSNWLKRQRERGLDLTGSGITLAGTPLVKRTAR